MHAEQNAATPTDTFGQAHSLRMPQLDQRKLGCDKKTVENDQQERSENVKNVGEHCSGWRRRAADSSTGAVSREQ